MAADGEDLPDTLSEKAINITVAMAEGIAEKRGRDKDALTKTITEAEAYTASVAVEVGLVDFVAVDMQDLLEQLDGRETETALGTVTMRTEGLVEREVDRNLAEKFFSFVANPNVIGLLLTFGSIGLFLELLSPGLIVPGVVGTLALIIGFVALGTLPFNWAGIVLLALAAILIFLEIQAPGIGILGVGGVIAFVLGALLLFSVGEPRLAGGSGTQDQFLARGYTLRDDGGIRPGDRGGGGKDAKGEVCLGGGATHRADGTSAFGVEPRGERAAEKRDVERGVVGGGVNRGGRQSGGRRS